MDARRRAWRAPLSLYVAGLLWAVAAPSAYGAGYAINAHGAASAGVGGASTARVDLPQAAIVNPAASLYAPGVSVGVEGLLGGLTHTSTSGVETPSEGAGSGVPNLSASLAWESFGLSASLHAPFGSSVAWPQGWAGRYESTGSSLSVLELGLNGAWRPHPDVSVSLGVKGQRLSFETSRAISTARQGADASVRVDGQSLGVAGQASVLWRATGALHVGATLRSATTHEARGVADFERVPVELDARARDSRATTTLVLPWRAVAGAAYVFEAGTLSADVELWGWGAVDTLRVDFDDEGVEDVEQPRAWSNTVSARAGYEHQVGQQWVVRVGGSWDTSPIPPQTLGASSPGSSRWGLHTGAGWDITPELRLDVAAQWLGLLTRASTNSSGLPGSYGGRVVVLSANVSWWMDAL